MKKGEVLEIKEITKDMEDMEDIVGATLQRGIPTPDKPVPIEHYIKVFGIWYKEVTDKEELELLEEK